MDFHNLVAQTLAVFAVLPCRAVSLPAAFSRIERNEIDGILVMENHFVDVVNRGQLRLVHIHAPKINVITLFFFPEYRWQIPVYCMELVVFGTQPIVGILDMMCLLPDMPCHAVVQHIMNTAHAAHSQLQQAADMPEWMTHCCSGNDFFIRPRDNDQVAELAALHLNVLADFTTLLQQPQLCTAQNVELHQNRLHNYKTHHRVHAPGLRLMTRSFGEQWTNDYMNHHLFT